MKPRLLDLFCGAGGAAMGYHRAGFLVSGIDLNPQPDYPFPFHQCEALAFMEAMGTDHFRANYDAIHASPPCQGYTTMNNRMGMPWADWNGVREAIPPAYTEYIGGQLLNCLAANGNGAKA